jgi:N-acetylglutamate synthase-like GNAT family acetyltransferase
MITFRPCSPSNAQGVRDLGNFWVADAPGKIVGTIRLVETGDRQVALRQMFVKVAYRGCEHGVAQRPLETALGWCEAHGVTDIYLRTTPRFLAVDTRCYRLPIITTQLETDENG